MKIVNACIFNMKKDSVLSRDDTPRDVRKEYSAGQIRQAMKDFSESITRCILVLYSDNNLEIIIFPKLREEAVAFEKETDRTKWEEVDPTNRLDSLWDIVIEVWK